MSQASLFDDALLDTPGWPPTPICPMPDAETFPALPIPETVNPPSVRTVDGWVKTFLATGTNPTPVLNQVVGDGHAYRPAKFALGLGVTVGEYPISKCRGVKLPGEKGLTSFYDAYLRGLVWEVKS